MRRLNSRTEQLSLWTIGVESLATTFDEQCTCDDLAIGDVNAMRAWLLHWGKLHGYPGIGFPIARDSESNRRWSGISHSANGWMQDTSPPYRHSPREIYPGEVLAAAVEQCKRYDAGEKIPWFEFNIGKMNARTHRALEDEEEE